jgi:hypothetical protein
MRSTSSPASPRAHLDHDVEAEALVTPRSTSKAPISASATWSRS